MAHYYCWLVEKWCMWERKGLDAVITFQKEITTRNLIFFKKYITENHCEASLIGPITFGYWINLILVNLWRGVSCFRCL